MGQPACNRDAIWELACRSDGVSKKKEVSKQAEVCEKVGRRRKAFKEIAERTSGKMHRENKPT